MVDAVPGIVYNEQAVRSVVFVNKLADVIVKLVLRLFSNIQFDDFGLVMEVFAEEGIKFSGLGVGQLVRHLHVLSSSAYLFPCPQLIQVVGPLDQQYGRL